MDGTRSNVYDFSGKGRGPSGPSRDGGEPPGGDDLDKRVEALEKAIPDLRERLVRVETKIDSIEKHGATKLDLSSTEGTLIKWFVGTAFAMTGLSAAMAFGLARFLG